MHGIELRDQERRDVSPVCSPLTVFPGQRIEAFRLAAAKSPARDRMFVPAFRSPVTTAAFAEAISGSKLLACHFTSQPAGSPARSAFLLCYRTRFAPVSGRFHASGPLQRLRPARLAFPPASTPLRDSYIPPDQSVQQAPLPVNSPSVYARFPLAPRRRFYF
jgi:hypothetical protein